ncbi:hypothetical protein ACOSP7_028735 [Xanthoceras sorbifolium]
MTSGKVVKVIKERAGMGNIAGKMISEGMSSDCFISVLHKVGENSDVSNGLEEGRGSCNKALVEGVRV